MTPPIPPHDEQPTPAVNPVEGPQAMMPPPLSASEPMVLPRQPEEEKFFSFEEEQPDLETAFVAPFQRSHAMPTVSEPAQPSAPASALPPTPAAPATPPHRRVRFSLPLIAILACVVVIAGLLVTTALAQTTPPLQTSGTGSPHVAPQPGALPQQPQGMPQKPVVKPTPAPTAAPATGTNEQGQAMAQASSDWVPQRLPDGWTNAGLLTEDAIQALRTAVAFNDREMSLDYRSVGTRTNHSGTFTAAVFVMTPSARQRFQRNDLRVLNNTLFDLVVTTKLVRLVVTPQPQLTAFAQRGQQQFVWVDVAFHLWQSQINPKMPQQRLEGKEMDPNTQQPRIHHMTVLLLRVAPQAARNTPAMGGTGWLVSNYGLDLPHGTPLEMVQPA